MVRSRIRYPIQAGDLGVCFPADAALGGVSGGTGTADLTQQANLSTLVFFPIGSSKWSATDNPNSLVLYGPDGAIIRNKNKDVTITLTSSGVVVKGSGAALALVTSAFEAIFNAHVHSDSGAGPPTAPMTSAQLTTILTAQ